MRMTVLFLLLACTQLAHAVSCTVLTIDDADDILIRYRDLQFSVPLAHVDISEAAQQRAQRVALLEEFLAGDEVRLIRQEEFGLLPDGRTPVHLRVDGVTASERLIAAGLAAYAPSAEEHPVYERGLADAQAAARQAGLGLWSADEDEEPTMVATADTETGEAAATQAGSREPPPFAAELTGRYYHPSDAPALADINPQRLIYYTSAAAAEQAGKRPAPRQVRTGRTAATQTPDAARAAFNRGKRLYAQAIAAGNTSRRDDLYAEAFSELTASVQIYSDLLEKRSDEELGEELRRAMQLRYGAMKQRRW